ncbi:MAG: type II toxin-antitoxin system VapB family antitoxin [Geodermatophilaceae bacterium]|jgi:Arc/MetJ family transcription regulator|nr:type II toxin-antitoxin system VapB family antitoxin [Geodermatophilaceae bacterium]
MTLRRTTIELDEELLARAKKALGQSTTRSTVEEALRRAVDDVQAVNADRAARQRRYLDQLADYVDLEVLESEQAWR